MHLIILILQSSQINLIFDYPSISFDKKNLSVSWKKTFDCTCQNPFFGSHRCYVANKIRANLCDHFLSAHPCLQNSLIHNKISYFFEKFLHRMIYYGFSLTS